MKYLHTSAIVAALIVAAPAMAQTVGVNLTTDLDASSSPVCLGSCQLHATGDDTPQIFDLTLGGPAHTITLGTAWVSSGFGGDDDASLTATLNFLDPTAGSASESSNVKYLRLGGFFTPGATIGSVTWDDASLDFSIGTKMFEFDPNNLSGITLNQPVPLTGDLKYVGNGAVPEPASWAMMLGGFGLVGGAMRRRKAATVSYAS